MFGFGKKKKEEKIDYDSLFIRETLNNLNLLNINNLIDMAEIEKSKQDKEEFKKIMNLIQPLILDAVKNGRTSGESGLIANKDDYNSFPHDLMHKLWDERKINVYMEGEKITTPDCPYRSYTFNLDKPFKYKFELRRSY